MKNIVSTLMLACLVLFIAVPANAQPCTPSIPSGEFLLGDTWCAEICGNWTPYTFFLVGMPGTNELNLPILTFQTGCSPTNTACSVDCTPLTPPTGDWVLGGDPFGFYPTWYFLGNECMWIMVRPSHNPSDNYWDIIIVGLCNGCFCFTFDHQLPVELLDFTAVAGDGEVQLNWRTASETSNDRFEIVRGEEKVAEIEAANSPTGDAYSWTDNSVVNGHVYTYSLYAVAQSGARELLNSAEASPNFNAGAVTEYALYQNYPNPFNPETQIAFDLVESGFVSLKVTNLLGQEVATAASGEFTAGRHVVNFNGSNLTSGVYLYTMSTGDFSATKKLVLLK